jgi:transcriptional regulator with XRE-family HTH domain
MQASTDTLKLVVAIRMARVALGLSQQELADHMEISKTTLARFETMEGGLSAELLTKLTRFFYLAGVSLDVISNEADVVVRVTQAGLNLFAQGLQDEERRRSDRRKSKEIFEALEGYGKPVKK